LATNSVKVVKVTDEELNKALMNTEDEKERKDPKKQWINKMIKSAKQYHKICPYYDRKTFQCFLMLGTKCPREGRFENCPVFIEFLDKKYTEISSKSKMLPMDFLDLSKFI
jgi:hypothetical protein